MSDFTIDLTPDVYQYLLKKSLREAPVLRDLRIQTHKMSMSKMQISPEQGQFMQLLVTLLQAKKTLDIGTFTGYSALAVAMALPADGKVIACDINGEWTKIAKRFWDAAGMSEKINLQLAPAIETLQNLITEGEENTFDFAFIDADKKNYQQYYELSLKLLRAGGLIAVDNVLWSGKVADDAIQDEDTNAIRQLNDLIHSDSRVQISLLPIGDGLTLARKI